MNEEAMAQRQADAKKSNSLLNITANEISTLDMETGVQGIAREHLNESMFGPDDFVLLNNIFDGKEHNGFQMPSLVYVFQYGGQPYRVQPGQQFTLSGAQAYIFVKHIVSLIYRRVEGNDDEDRRTYAREDKWVNEIVARVQETLNPEGSEITEIKDVPAYVQDDPNLSKTIGGGDFELKAQVDDSDATDETINAVPDFTPALNPRQEFDSEGNVIKHEDNAADNVETTTEEVAFPDAKQNQGKPSSQKKK